MLGVSEGRNEDMRVGGLVREEMKCALGVSEGRNEDMRVVEFSEGREEDIRVGGLVGKDKMTCMLGVSGGRLM